MIKFLIKARFKNTLNEDLYEVEKIVKKKEKATYNKKLLYKRYIRAFFTTEIKEISKNENIDTKNLKLDSYDIVSLNEDINIHYLSNNNGLCEIYAVLNEDIIRPELRGEIINKNSIRWNWDYNKYASYLLDENDNIISQNAVGVSAFIETDLKFGGTYSRKLVLFSADAKSETSNICSITIDKEEIKYVDKPFELDKRDENIIEQNIDIASRMEAFKSGVGDSKDLLILKSDNLEYIKRFKLINKIYGVRANPKVKHNTIKFDFRFKLQGLVDKLGFDSSFDITVKAREITNVGDFDTPKYVGQEIVGETVSYEFNNDCFVADIHMINFFNRLTLNYKKRYEFKIAITNVKGQIEILSYRNGKCNAEDNVNIEFTERGYYDHKLSVKALPKTITTTYEEIYPPVEYTPLTGAINGDFTINESGLKDMRYEMPSFDTSEFVYDKKYYCIIEKVSPSAGYVQYKFDNAASKNDYTLVNGDSLVFSSMAILEDNKEQRDFLIQLESEEYSINDNRKHIYNYSLNEIQVDKDRYKRFELEVVPSNNDVIVLDNTKNLNIEDGFVNTDVTVHVRAIQNAIAKWNPVVNSGYYYLNNDEYYLYSKCISDGEGRILNDVFFNPSVSIRTTVEALEPVGEIERYSITKNSMEDLLIDANKFFFENGRIYPRPTRIIEDYYYEFDDEYTYISAPFIFNKRPTSIDLISYFGISNDYNEMDFYIRPYNDVYGEWDKPILLEDGGVPDNIFLSKIYTFVVKLRPSKRPRLVNRNLNFTCEANYEKYIDKFLSKKVYYKEDVLMPKSKGNDGFFISKKIDLGDTADKVKNRKILFSLKSIGNVRIFIEQTDNEEDLDVYRNKWVEVSNNKEILNVKRFFRFKILLDENAALFSMKLNVNRYEYKDMNMDSYMPSFNKLRIDATYNPDETKRKYEDVQSYNLEFDGEKHIIIENLSNYVTSLANALSFDKNRVVSIKIEPYGSRKEDFTVVYNGTVPITESKVYLRSKSIIYDYESIENNHGGVVYPVNNKSITITPIPQQYSPVIIYKIIDSVIQSEPLTQVPFFDENGFTLYNTEEFIIDEFKTFYLEYVNIDLNSVRIEINGNTVNDYDIINNVLKLNSDYTKGDKLVIKYKLLNSYCVNYNYFEDSVKIDFSDNLEKVRVFIETNKDDCTRKISNISLNPIYSTVYDGYIYISDYSYKPSKLEIFPEDDFIFANGKDTMNVLIKVTDKNNNPVERISVNVNSSYGEINILNKQTDQNGIIHCIYKSANLNAIDNIKGITSNGIVGETNIVNRRI